MLTGSREIIEDGRHGGVDTSTVKPVDATGHLFIPESV